MTEAAFEALAREVADLRERLERLEENAGIQYAGAVVAAAEPERRSWDAASAAPIFGKAMLGLAGAWLLRALSEMGALPISAGVAIGIAYAITWLVLAARAAERGRGLAAVVHAVTSVLILTPLIWEAVLRFTALPHGVAGAVLCLYSVFGLAISWRHNLSVVAWITTLGGLFSTAALMLATHDLPPFLWALAGLALAVEVSAVFDHWLRERWIVAVVADLGAAFLLYLAVRPGPLPEVYAPFGLRNALPAIGLLAAAYAGSAVARTLWRGRRFSAFEAVQCAAIAALAFRGAWAAAPGAAALGAVVTALACYAAAFRNPVNFAVYAGFGSVLALLGTGMGLSGTPRTAAFAVLAVAALASPRLRAGACVFLGAALLDSGLASDAWTRLLGHPAPGPITGAEALAALASAIFLVRLAAIRESGAALAFAAGAAAWSAAALLAHLAALACRGPGGRDACGALTMAALAAVAAACAWLRNRLDSASIGWAVYGLALLATVKLALRDIRGAQALSSVFSLLIYAVALLTLPRLLQKKTA